MPYGLLSAATRLQSYAVIPAAVHCSHNKCHFPPHSIAMHCSWTTHWSGDFPATNPLGRLTAVFWLIFPHHSSRPRETDTSLYPQAKPFTSLSGRFQIRPCAKLFLHKTAAGLQCQLQPLQSPHLSVPGKHQQCSHHQSSQQHQ